MKQLNLISSEIYDTRHGGDHTALKRKRRRPLCSRRPIHIVVRATQAKGEWSLLQPKNSKALNLLLDKYSKKFFIRVYSKANVGNHCHLLVRAKTREGFANFLRVFTGQLAQFVTGSQKGNKLKKRFWDLLAFSRVVEWGIAYSTAKKYLQKNIHQAAQTFFRISLDSKLLNTS